VLVPLSEVAVAASSIAGNCHSQTVAAKFCPELAFTRMAPPAVFWACCDPIRRRLFPRDPGISQIAMGALISGTLVVQLSEGPPVAAASAADPGLDEDRIRLPLPCTLQTAGQCRAAPVTSGGPPVIRHVCVWSSW
jgi:hypothetical protein